MSEYFTPLIVGNNITELSKSTLPASVADEAGHYPFFCSSAEVKATTTWLQEKPTVLMGTGGVASVNYGEDRFAYSTDTWGIRSNNAKLETKFLFRKIQQHLPRIDYAGFEGSGLRHLRKDYVKKLKIDVPSPSVQSRIVEILDSHDRAIEKTEALITKYQQIKAGLMHDLFTRGVTADGKLRPPREQAPELYQETPIGWIPKEWEVKPLAAFTQHDITYGIVQAGPHVENGVPYIRTGDMAGNSLIKNELLCTSRVIADSYKRSEVRVGEIICAIRATVGKVLRVPPDLDGANLTQGTARIAPSAGTNAAFLLWAIRTERTQRTIMSSIKGTTFSEITLGDLRKLLVAAPSNKDEQKLIGERLAISDNMIRVEGDHLDKLRQQKLGLMSDLLTGKVRVKVEQETA